MKLSKEREIEICFQHIAEYDKVAQENNVNGVDTQCVAILWRRRLREINQARLERRNKRVKPYIPTNVDTSNVPF